MDPITTAILTTLPAIASGLLESSVKDAYEALKAVIRRKWGDGNPVAKSITALEANPKSKGQAAVLAESVESVDATADSDVMGALGKLLDELKKAKFGESPVAQITANISGGNVGVGVGQNVSIGTQNVGPRRKAISADT